MYQIDEFVRKHIQRKLGEEAVKMAAETNFAYGRIDENHGRSSLYVVCCHCRRTWSQSLDLMEISSIEDRLSIEIAFFSHINSECHVPYLISPILNQ